LDKALTRRDPRPQVRRGPSITYITVLPGCTSPPVLQSTIDPQTFAQPGLRLSLSPLRYGYVRCRHVTVMGRVSSCPTLWQSFSSD